MSAPAGGDTKPARIAILTGASLPWNPRALKEAISLSRAEFEVAVYGVAPDHAGLEVNQELARRHGFKFVAVAPSSLGEVDRSALHWPRLRHRLGCEAFRLFALSNRWQIGLFVPELLQMARNARAHYYIIHLEQALWVGRRLMMSGHRVGVDMEDWFSEDLMPEARIQRPVRLLQRLEQTLLRGATHSSCTSRAMAKALTKEYNCRPPIVIYNAFPWADRNRIDGQRKDRRDRRAPTIHWFSQTLGPGRGLEDLLAALPHLKHEAEIHLRGKPVSGFHEWLGGHVPEMWRSRVWVHDLVSNDELLSRIAEHDIGFAGEMKYCRSRDLTVTNKILHYLLGGLAVVASDTAGQREVAEQARGAVRVYPSGDPLALAAQLNALVASADDLMMAKAAALRAAEQTFCWERQSPKLLLGIEQALS